MILLRHTLIRTGAGFVACMVKATAIKPIRCQALKIIYIIAGSQDENGKELVTPFRDNLVSLKAVKPIVAIFFEGASAEGE